MPLPVDCDRCGTTFEAGEAAGPVDCPHCGAPIAVPNTAPGRAGVEVSGSGEPIYRHAARDHESRTAPRDPESLEEIGEHIERHLGEVAGVFHELVSEVVHLDVHRVDPTADRPFHTLITSGMSDLPMHVPEGAEDFRFAELLICLPASWPMTREEWSDERYYWPIRWLKTLARLPHQYRTWLAPGHTIPYGDPAEPFAPGTAFCCWLLLTPTLTPEEFDVLPIDEGKTIRFLAMVPLYKDEMDFKLEHGIDALWERLQDRGVTELLDVRRENACARTSGPMP